MTFGAIGGTLNGGASGGSVSDLWRTLYSDGVNTANSARPVVTATASATPHTKGAWVEIDASLSAEAHLVFLEVSIATATNSTDTSTLLDIGVGGAGSESVVVANIPIGYTIAGHRMVIPVAIPAGSRVAVRCQSVVASKQVVAYFAFSDLDVANKPATALVTMGANLAASRGVSLSAPGAINTKGAWTEIEDATAQDFEALIIAIQGGGDATFATADMLIDIGIGAGGAEVALFADIFAGASSNELFVTRILHMTRSAAIPAGSRLSARYQASASGSDVDMILIGVPVQ